VFGALHIIDFRNRMALLTGIPKWMK